MLNTKQKKRFVLVLILPLIIVGLWLSEKWDKLLGPSYLNIECNIYDGRCISYHSDLSYYATQRKDGLSLVSSSRSSTLDRFSDSSATITGALHQQIVLIDSGVTKTLKFRVSQNEDFPSCYIEYYKQLDQMDLVDGKLKVKSSTHDFFDLDCNEFSENGFRFADKNMHENVVIAWNKSVELARESYKGRSRVSIFAFIFPFILFGCLWGLVAFFVAIFRFVRGGKICSN